MNQSLIKTGAVVTAASLTLGGFAGALVEPSAAAELATPQRAPTAEPNLQISYDQGTFQGTLQAALTSSGDAASPTLETSTLTVDGSGFSTVYAYTSLSEVINHY